MSSKENTRKQLALLMEKVKDIPVDPVWTKAGRAMGESMWAQLEPYLAVSGTDPWSLSQIQEQDVKSPRG